MSYEWPAKKGCVYLQTLVEGLRAVRAHPLLSDSNLAPPIFIVTSPVYGILIKIGNPYIFWISIFEYRFMDFNFGFPDWVRWYTLIYISQDTCTSRYHHPCENSGAYPEILLYWPVLYIIVCACAQGSRAWNPVELDGIWMIVTIFRLNWRQTLFHFWHLITPWSVIAVRIHFCGRGSWRDSSVCNTTLYKGKNYV